MAGGGAKKRKLDPQKTQRKKTQKKRKNPQINAKNPQVQSFSPVKMGFTIADPCNTVEKWRNFNYNLKKA